MINQLLKWSVILTIWKKYGSAIKVLPLLLLVVLLVYALHGDYVEYAEVSNEKQYLALSFLIKWLAIFVVIGAYWMYIKKVLTSKQSLSLTGRSLKDRLRTRKTATAEDGGGMDESSEPKASVEKALSAQDEKSEEKNENVDLESDKQPRDPDASDTRDPFHALRKKKHLRSEAELILDKKSKQD